MVVSLAFFINGSTSCFTIFISVVNNLSFKCSINSFLLISSPLNCLIRSCKCAKLSGTPFRTYHSKSYQSRPFTRFFHLRNSKACIFPANRSDKVRQRTMKEKGCSKSLSSVENSIGGFVSTSIFIFILFSV